MAFQTYAGLLGVRLPGAVVATSDADFAQFHSVSVAVEDSLPPILDILRGVDPSFGPVPSVKAKGQASAFANLDPAELGYAKGGEVEPTLLAP